MRRTVAVSAPGKVILMGEHAAVYGRPAIVAALDLRCRVELRPTEGGLHLDLEALGWQGVVANDAPVEIAREAAREWHDCAHDPSPRAFAQLRSREPADFVSIALGEAALSLGLDRLPDVEVTVRSDIPVGSGFGSSAATAVALAAAVSAWTRGHAPADWVEVVAFECERRQHGTPSGIDPKVVVHGGVGWAEPRGGDLAFDPLDSTSRALASLSIYDTGRPSESTGDMVSRVRDLRAEDPARFDRILDRMESCTQAFRHGLAGGAPGELRDSVIAVERCLEQLGVVPSGVRDRIREIERRGGAAKISGAGGVSGTGAGSLLVFGEVGGDELLASYGAIDAGIGAQGLLVELGS